MRIHVTGGGGVLGRAVIEAATALGVDVEGYRRQRIDITNRQHAKWLGSQVASDDVVINCAGEPVTHGTALTPEEAGDVVRSNAYGPHVLAMQTGCPIVHVSTDCVFNGRDPGPRYEDTTPDPLDLYGRSKLVGEVQADHVLNVRGSFVSWQSGMLAWLRQQEGVIDGWTNAHYSGLYVRAYARVLVELAKWARSGLFGTVHVPGELVTKADLLDRIAFECGLPVTVRRVDTPVIYRGLGSVRWSGLGIKLPTWDEMMPDVIEDCWRTMAATRE